MSGTLTWAAIGAGAVRGATVHIWAAWLKRTAGRLAADGLGSIAFESHGDTAHAQLLTAALDPLQGSANVAGGGAGVGGGPSSAAGIAAGVAGKGEAVVQQIGQESTCYVTDIDLQVSAVRAGCQGPCLTAVPVKSQASHSLMARQPPACRPSLLLLQCTQSSLLRPSPSLGAACDRRVCAEQHSCALGTGQRQCMSMSGSPPSGVSSHCSHSCDCRSPAHRTCPAGRRYRLRTARRSALPTLARRHRSRRTGC